MTLHSWVRLEGFGGLMELRGYRLPRGPKGVKQRRPSLLLHLSGPSGASDSDPGTLGTLRIIVPAPVP